MPDSGQEYVSLDGNSGPWYRRLVQTTKSTDRKIVVLCVLAVVIIGLLSYILFSNNSCPVPVTVAPFTVSSTTPMPTSTPTKAPVTTTTPPSTTVTSTTTAQNSTTPEPTNASVKPEAPIAPQTDNSSQPVTH